VVRKRLRNTIKWGGTGLTVLLVMVWVGSAWWWANWTCNFPNVDVGVWRGRVVVEVNPPNGWSRMTAFGRSEETAMTFWVDWDINRAIYGSRAGRVSDVWFAIPLWMLVVLCALPTAQMHYSDQRSPNGICPKCGYDLRGNASGVCPKCGGEAPRELKVEG